MLIGYVSDEQHLALDDVGVELRRDGDVQAITRSNPRGAIYADVSPGEYTATLAKDGYGSKRVSFRVSEDSKPRRFRLLSDRLLGYMDPICSRAGEKAEYRIHGTEEVRVTLWRYGEEKEFVRPLNWHGEHGP
jgi:hypothetical protein